MKNCENSGHLMYNDGSCDCGHFLPFKKLDGLRVMDHVYNALIEDSPQIDKLIPTKLWGGPVEGGDGIYEDEVCIAVIKDAIYWNGPKIVNAVNSHEVLLTAVKNALVLVRTEFRNGETQKELEKAIAQAEGKS